MLTDILYSYPVKCVIFLMFICYGSQALASLDCNFEEGLCNWMQDKTDAFNWLRASGDTPTWFTGPRSDHTKGGIYYVYVEANGRNKGDIARLNSLEQKPGRYCLGFWYSMYGQHIGALNVYIKSEDGNEKVFFSRLGNSGKNVWRNVFLDVNLLDKFTIVIEGIRGDGIWGDIAIDDISMTKGTCSDCDFDKGFCYWTQADSDDFDWTLQKGQTTSSNTGPLFDHTSRHGSYIYIEANNKLREDVAWLVSPRQQAGKYCFSLWYHMYGEHVDRLRIGLGYINGTVEERFRKTGNQGNNWIRGNIIMKSSSDFQVILEGRIKDAADRQKGDIAVDDVMMVSCHDCDNPIPNNAAANSTIFEYGSVIEIKCNPGYSLVGEVHMVCQANGLWDSNRPECKRYDCMDRNITNGNFNAPNGTTFGQTASQVCKTGYTLYGDTTVTCISSGWNGTAGTCTIIDCMDRNITNGNFIAPNGTTFGQTASQVCKTGYTLYGDTTVTCISSGWNGTAGTCTVIDCGDPTPRYANVNSTHFKYGTVVEITCNTGYNITGKSVLVCLANGSWSSRSPKCEPFDCGNKTLDNGHFSAPNGTTFGQTATHVCNIGYTLMGDKTVTCTISGWKSIAGTCKTEDSGNDALIAVYVLVPVVVIILVVLLTIIYVRRRFPNSKKVSESKHESCKNHVMAAANKTYNGLALESQNHINRAYEDRSLDGNGEYATISDEQNSNNIYQNTTASEGTRTEHDAHNYDHAKNTAAHFVDQSYAHISKNKNGMKLEPNYNTTMQLDPGNANLRKQAQSDMNDYDLLNINMNKDAKHRNELEDGIESDYDHAHAGGIDPVEIDNDDYSHLNDVNIKQKYPASFGGCNGDEIECSYTNEHSTRKGKDAEKSKVGYEQESSQVTNTNDRHYFVLEAEEVREGSDEPENHDHFVLEKTDSYS